MSALARFRLDGRVALVTGASSGLGVGFARALAEAGASVALAARRVDLAAQQARRIEADGGRATAFALDVSDAQSIAAALDAIEAELGSVQVLVNNAGVAGSARALDVGAEDWRRVMATNLDGVWSMAQAVARRLVDRQLPGAIVNIASILGERQRTGTAPYATSKAAVVQLSKSLALEWARHSIRVNALAPGYITTDLNRDYLQSEAGQEMINNIPQRRVGSREELAGPLLLLASDAGSFITGSVLAVDGGHLVSSL